VSYRIIAERFGTSPAAVFRHKSHAAQAIQRACERHEEQLGDSLLDEMRRVQRKAWELLSKTESEGDHRGSIVALREVRECQKSLGDMLSRADAADGLAAQDERWDMSRLSDEQLQQLEALMVVAYGMDSLEGMMRQK